ncbi:MAG: hypothetical protein K0V04_45115, partial [Deltaproteobacteria bacterium]|nr:hypothetical protein [Deltaproteobacteria bacterium]
MSIERVAAGLEVVGEILGRPTSDPDPDRQDWGIHSDVLDTLVRTAKDEVLEPVDDALAQLGDDPEQASRIRSVVADRLGDCAGLLLAANRDHDARALLMGSCRVAQSGPIADLSSAGLADTRRFTRIIRAWWLVHHDRRKDAADV